jgi:hypothetical protein
MKYRGDYSFAVRTLILCMSIATFALISANAKATDRLDLEGPLYAGEGHTVIGPFTRNEVSATVRFRGFLNFPRNASGPLPLIIITHSAGGWGAKERQLRTQ